MRKKNNPYRYTRKESADLSHPPSGGVIKIAVLGLLLPGWIGLHAWQSWTTQETSWIEHLTHEKISGIAAQWMAGVYLAVALFCFSRWCIGIIAPHPLFPIGTVTSISLFLICLAGAFWTVMVAMA